MKYKNVFVIWVFPICLYLESTHIQRKNYRLFFLFAKENVFQYSSVKHD